MDATTHRRRSGFTIVELIVVVSVIAILAAIIIVSYGAWQKSVRGSVVKSDLSGAAAAMEVARNASTAPTVGYPSSIPSSFVPSADVTFPTPPLMTLTEFCIDAHSTPDPTIEYYIYSKTKDKGAQAGNCASRPDLTPPAQPASVVIASVTGTVAVVNWASVPNAASYTAQCASDPAFIYGPQQATATQVAGTVTATVSGLLPDSSFYCRVKAINLKGASAWSSAATAQATCPQGFVAVPGSVTYGTSAFCIMKYEAKQTGGTIPISQPGGIPWGNITQTNAIAYSANVADCSGCHLVTEAEWLTVMQNVLSVASNWSGGSVGSGFIYSGHNDVVPAQPLPASISDSDGYNGTGQTTGNQRRTLTLTNGEVVWDMSGNVSEWTQGTATTGKPGGVGLVVREWNAVGVPGTLSPNPFPAFGTPAASGWTTANGIGALVSNSSDTALNGFVRGGDYGSGVNAGISTLVIAVGPTFSQSYTGFRVAR